MKKIWNKPITWGNYLTLCIAALVLYVPYYIYLMIDMGLVSLDEAQNKLSDLKKKICSFRGKREAQ